MSLPVNFFWDDTWDSQSGSSSRQPSRNTSTYSIDNPTNEVQAVIVSTQAMSIRANFPVFSQISLASTDPIFTANEPASISKIFNIPLLARSLTIQDRPDVARYFREIQLPNLQAKSLFTNCAITACENTAGSYPWDWEFGQDLRPRGVNEGPVILVRADKKPLLPVHAQMILGWVDGTVRQAFELYLDYRGRWATLADDQVEVRDNFRGAREMIEAMVKEGAMREEWVRFVAENAGACAGVESPWDV